MFTPGEGNVPTLKRVLKNAAAMLQGAGVEEPEADACALFSYVSGMDRTAMLLHGQEPVGGSVIDAFRDLISKRCRQIPVQHLTGEQNFAGLTFKVTPQVLIPRMDTELLYLTARDWLDQTGAQRVLDLCTGSGCLAVSLAKAFPGRVVSAADISGEALLVAKENAERHQVQITFLQGDLFAPVTGTYDLIVSNPPYIATDVIRTLSIQVRDYEPHLALDGGSDGLNFYRKIADQAGDYLRPGGKLMLEIGYDQGRAVTQLLQAAGFRDVCVLQDLAGLDRVVTGNVSMEGMR